MVNDYVTNTDENINILLKYFWFINYFALLTDKTRHHS